MSDFTQYNKKLKGYAREMRKAPTRHEKLLWYGFLRKYPIKFYRQRPIGNYIVDFYCSELKLVIELDGRSHNSEDAVRYDNARTKYLESLGLRVHRIRNGGVEFCYEDVCEEINGVVNELLGR